MTIQDFLGKENYTIQSQTVSESCPSNIALIKYWGKYDNQIPANPSISFTLNNCKTNTTLEFYKNPETKTIISSITEKATIQGQEFEKNIENFEVDENTTLLQEVMNKTPQKSSIVSQVKDLASQISLPQFFIKVEDEVSDGILFDELKSDEELLHKGKLLDGFNLLTCDTQINFDEISAELYKIDFDESKGTSSMSKITQKAKSILVDSILTKPQDSQIRQVSSLIVSKLGDMTPISDLDLKKYVARIFDGFSPEQIRDVVNNEYIYIQKIKNKISNLTNNYAQNKFKTLIDSNQIFVKPSFTFSESFTPLNTSTPIAKSLYTIEDSMNSFEQKMIMELASLDNVFFWHRNLNKGKGFYINGFSTNHYPDFIIYTQKGNIVLIETKGDDRVNDDSLMKNKLGKLWAEKSGSNFKYFMVFQTKEVEDCYNANSIIEVLKRL